MSTSQFVSSGRPTPKTASTGESGRSKPERFAGLEILRFGAAVSVLIWHYQHFLQTGLAVAILDPQTAPFYDSLKLFYTQGYYGVELFWGISGFIFAWKYGAAINSGAVSFGRFAALRASRLYPLHLVTLLIVALLGHCYYLENGRYFVYINNDLYHFGLNLLFASHWGIERGDSFNGPSWSLSVEIIIYVLFFGLSRIFRCGFKQNLALAVFFAGLSIFCRRNVGSPSDVSDAAAFFYCGSVAQSIFSLTAGLSSMLKASLATLSCVLIFTVVELVLSNRVRTVWAVFLLVPVTIYMFSILGSWTIPKIEQLLEHLGNLTYASYMIHFPVQLTIVLMAPALNFEIQSIFFRPGFFIGYIGGVFIISQFLFYGFEKPAQAFLRGYLNRRPMGRG